jgi:hypothetical protein
MTPADEWDDFPGDLDPKSVSFREERCTWHGEGCSEQPTKVVRTRDGRRWAACARAVREIAAARGSAT